MFSHLYNSFTSNQLLVAGVSTVALANIGKLYTSIRNIFNALATRHLMSTVHVHETHGVLVHQLAKVLNNHSLSITGRNFAIDRKGGLVAGYGTGMALCDGLLMFFKRSWEKTDIYTLEKLDIWFLTRSTARVANFIEATRQSDSVRDNLRILAYINANSGWQEQSMRRKRAIETVFANANTVTKLLESVRWFIENEQWYISRGITYKYCIMLDGPPGVGKTTLIHAIASYFNKDIYALDSLWSIASAAAQVNEGAILAIEDMDTLAKLNRKPSKEIAAAEQAFLESMDCDPQKILGDVLNVLDGLATPHGMIAIVTSNVIEAFDEALLRPGRIDMRLTIEHLQWEAFEIMFESFYPRQKGLLTKLQRSKAYKPLSGASLQECFMRNIDDAVKALQEVETRCSMSSRKMLQAAE